MCTHPDNLRQAGARKKFVFLAHWVENWNWLLWWSDDLHKHPEHAWRWAWLWPVAAIAAICYLVGSRAYDVVDRFLFNGKLAGETWLVRNFAWHFLKSAWREKIRKRILRAVMEAQRHGVQVIGLGALTKAEWLTAGGEWIVKTLGDRLHTPIVHGDTLTAATVIHRAMGLINTYRLWNKPVLVTGATSKIGRAVVLALATHGIKVYMYTASQERFSEIRREAGETSHLLRQVTSFREAGECALWITGKAEPGAGKKLIRAMPHEAIVLNFSVPDPLSPRLLRRRPDIHHFDGGLLGYDLGRTNLRFTMRLRPGLTYACHAGTMVHAAAGWNHHEVGQVEMHQVEITWQVALAQGFFLPGDTSFLRPIRSEKGTTPWVAEVAKRAAVF